MKTSDVTDTLELALQASGCDQAHVALVGYKNCSEIIVYDNGRIR
jgi:hypothetical protein